MGLSHTRRLRWLLAITILLLLGGGFVSWWRADEPSRTAMARVFGLHRPGPEWRTKPGSLISTARSTWSETTGEASVPDRYETLPVIERREEPPGTQPRVRWLETKLVRDERFKYPLLRVVEQWQPGEKGPVRVRQQAMVADHVVVKLRSGARIETLLQRFPLLDPQVRRRLPASGLWLLSFREADLDTVPRAIAELRKASDLVQAVQADFIAHISATPTTRAMLADGDCTTPGRAVARRRGHRRARSLERLQGQPQCAGRGDRHRAELHASRSGRECLDQSQ